MSLVTYSDKPASELHDIRYVGVIMGCYSLSSRENAKDGSESVFACRTISISTMQIDILAPVRGELGENVRFKLDEFEIISGEIVQIKSSGFVASITATDEERTQIAGTIDWIKKRKFRDFPDKRKHKRRMLPNPRTGITLEDGSVIECFVIDVSQSGVAVSADIQPKIGTPLAVGKSVGVVARILEVGFAVKFLETLDTDNPEAVFAWSLKFLDKESTIPESPLPDEQAD